MKHLFHEEIGGGYGMRQKITIDTTEIEPGKFETMVLNAQSDELDRGLSNNAQDAERDFRGLIQRYALPLQAAFYRAELIPGQRYTLIYLGELGFPVCLRLTFHSAKLDTYAQYDDVVNLVFTPYKKRQARRLYLYNRSFLLYAGWRELDETATYNVEHSGNGVVTMISKYGSCDEQYITDIRKKWPDFIAAYDRPRFEASDNKADAVSHEPEPRKPYQLLPGLKVVFDAEGADGPCLDIESDDFAALYTPVDHVAVSPRERLERALKRSAIATIAHLDDDDGGTCNFDSPAIDFAACGMTMDSARQAIESVGLSCFDWKPFKDHRTDDGKLVKAPTFLVIGGFQSGQGYRRTHMAEAFCDAMNNEGYETRMYYQMD